MVDAEVNLTIVKIYWEGKEYQVKVGGVKDPDKMTIEKIYSTDKLEPNKVEFGKKEYSIDLSKVQSHRALFEWIMERQESGVFKNHPGLTVYKSKNGVVKPTRVYKDVFVEEISPENNGAFDVKLVPITKVKRQSANKLYAHND